MPRKKRSTKKTTNKKSPAEIKQANTSNVMNIRWGESYISLLLGALVVVFAAVIGFLFVKLQQPKQELLPPATIAKNINVTIALTNPGTLHTNSVLEKPHDTQITPTVTPVIKQDTPTPTVIQKQTMMQAVTSGNQKTYTVQKGDNLWTIAEKEYGSGYSYVSIEQANNLGNPGLIFSGDKLIIPSVTPILLHKQTQVSPTPQPTARPTVTPVPTKAPVFPAPTVAFRGTQYTIQKGDNLWTIAVKTYGNGYRWVDIAKANHLTNPGIINVGNTLSIPRP